MRTVAVITTSRADYGILRPVIAEIAAHADLQLRLMVSGTHLSPLHGHTVEEIERDGFPIARRIDMMMASGTPEATAVSMGLATIAFARAYAESRPDLLVVLGDRFEVHAAVLAALPATIPVAHIHGGEVTAGAIDESLRHSITKLSHLHFVATEKYAQRVIQLGEEPWRVTLTGSPSLDGIAEHKDLPVDELETLAGMPLPERGFLIVTFHSTTVEWAQAGHQAEELFAALEQSRFPVLLSLPNADPGGADLRAKILSAVAERPRWRAVENLGTRAYFTVLGRAAAMVGNSSSGLIEAPSFGLPAVNIGARQQGRVRGLNVIDVPCSAAVIAEAIGKATTPVFRELLKGRSNPYGDGSASRRIVSRLRAEPLTARLLKKTFFDQADVKTAVPEAAE